MKCQRGMSLVELLIVVGISVVATMAITTAVQLATKGEQFVQTSENILQMVHEVQTALKNTSICEHNFKGAAYVPGNPPRVTDLKYLTDVVILAEGGDYFDVRVLPGGLEFSERAFIPASDPGGVDSAIVDLNIEVERKGKVSGPKKAVRQVAVFFNIRGGVIESCSTDSLLIGGGDDFYNRVCIISSDGRKKYDPVTGVCIDAVASRCFRGTRDRAECQAPYTEIAPIRNNCRAVPPSGFSDSSNFRIDRNYNVPSGTRVSQGGPPPAIYSVDTSSNPVSCQCFYAADLADSSGFRCEICCEEPIPSS